MNSGLSNFRKEAIHICAEFPNLEYSEDQDGTPYLYGKILLLNESNNYIDAYLIKIEPSANYPHSFPYVFEKGGRLPINVDWHMFNDGHCCIKSMPEETLICKEGINLSSFIREQVVPYFFNQKHRELHGYYLHERSHGMDGNIEFFQDVFETTNLKAIARSLFFIARNPKPNRVDACFCGSNLKFRKCCRSVYDKMRGFGNEDLELYIQMIITSARFQI